MKPGPTLYPCTKEEFLAFLDRYPRALVRDVWGASTPMMVTYNDFSGGKVWPESVIASKDAEDSLNRGSDLHYRIAKDLLADVSETANKP